MHSLCDLEFEFGLLLELESDLLINKPRLLVCLFVYFVIKQPIKPRGLILVVNQALYRLV